MNNCVDLSSPAPSIKVDPVEVSVAVLSDVDEYGASISGFATETQQLSSGVFTGSTYLASFGDVQLFRLVTSQRIYEQFVSRPNSLSIALPLSLSEPVLFRGTQVNHGEIVCFPGDDASTYYTAHHTDLLALTFDIEDFASYAEQVKFSDDDRRLTTAAFLKVAPKREAALRVFLQSALKSLIDNPSVLQCQRVQESLRESIYANVLNVLGPSDNLSAFAMPKQRYALVARAREYLFHDPHCETFTIGELCRFLGVGSRTLEYAFQDVLGMTAVAYLRALRLNYVRQEIKSGGPNSSVLDIAARWGFWHPSHFSADYKRLFGDLPSETRRRHAG